MPELNVVRLESVTRQRLRAAGRTLVSLLLGAVAIFGAVLAFRQGLLPLIDATFHPGAAWLSGIRRAGIVLAAVAAYWAYVHWYDKREATELRLQSLRTVPESPTPRVSGCTCDRCLISTRSPFAERK